MPAVSARNRTAPPTAAARRGSESICNSMRLGSVVTGLRKSDVASFPAIRAVVQAIRAETYIVHAFADGAVFLAAALVFCFVALHANDRAVRHQMSPKETLPERKAPRQDARAAISGRVATATARSESPRFIRCSEQASGAGPQLLPPNVPERDARRKSTVWHPLSKWPRQ